MNDISFKIFYPSVSPNTVTQYSMQFDGVAEFITIPDDASYDFDGTTPFSMSVWFNSSDFTGFRPLFSKRVINGAGYMMSAFNGGLYFGLNNSNLNRIEVNTSMVLSTNTWYLFTVTYDGSQTAAGVKLYVNDAEEVKTINNNNLTLSSASGEPLQIGVNGTGGALFWLDYLGYIRIWNVELTAQDVIDNYNGGIMSESPVNPLDLVLGWKSGTGALFNGTTWSFVDETDTNINPAPISVNMEFADRTTNIP